MVSEISKSVEHVEYFAYKVGLKSGQIWPREKHMLESEKSHARLDFVSHIMTQAKSRVTRKTHYLELFKVCFSHSFTNTI